MTLESKKQQIYMELVNRLGLVESKNQRGFLQALSWALSSRLLGVDLSNANLMKQVFINTATDDSVVLMWSDLVGITQTQGRQSELTVKFTGAEGTLIPLNTLLTFTENNTNFRVFEEGVISGGTGYAKIRAEKIGTFGNLDVGDVLNFSTISGLESGATVYSLDVSGVEKETISELQERIISVLRNKPTGGSASDYKNWAESVEGIAKAYPVTEVVGGVKVVIYLKTTKADRLADSSDIQEVISKLNGTSEGIPAITPITDFYNSSSIRTVEKLPSLHFVVGGLSPDNSANRTLVENSLKQYVEVAEPFNPATTNKDNSKVDIVNIKFGIDTLLQKEGATINSLQMFDNASLTVPIDSVEMGFKYIVDFGSVTYGA